MEQRAQTRADLLAAARDRFLEVGYAAASLEDIAERAGYSKGAVYSNFVDKPNLCREVLQAIHAERIGELADQVTGTGDLHCRIDMLEGWVKKTAGDVGWTMLELEFITVARNDPELLAMIVELRAEARRTVVEMLVDLVRSDTGREGDIGTDLRRVLESAAELMLSAGIGLGIQRAIDPTIATEPVIEAMRATLSMLAMAGS